MLIFLLLFYLAPAVKWACERPVATVPEYRSFRVGKPLPYCRRVIRMGTGPIVDDPAYH